MIQGKCEENHEGPLCFNCKGGFVKISSSGLCQSCEENIFFYLKFVISFSLIIGYVIFQIRLVLKSSSSTSGNLLKILLTHFQQISLISVLQLGWTPDFKAFFFFQSYLSLISDEIFNFDCFSFHFEPSSFVKTLLITII